MANNLTTLNREFWLAEAQIIWFKESMALEVAAVELRETLRSGDIINHPDISHPQSVSYTKGSAITNKDRFSANEQLTVSTARVVPFYVDEVDRIQNDFVTQQTMAQHGQRQLNNVLDQYVVNLGYTNATSNIDAGKKSNIAGEKFDYMLETVVRFLVGGLNPLKI